MEAKDYAKAETVKKGKEATDANVYAIILEQRKEAVQNSCVVMMMGQPGLPRLL